MRDVSSCKPMPKRETAIFDVGIRRVLSQDMELAGRIPCRDFIMLRTSHEKVILIDTLCIGSNFHAHSQYYNNSHHDGCWWPGACSAPGHLPPCWRMPVSAHKIIPTLCSNALRTSTTHGNLNMNWIQYAPRYLMMTSSNGNIFRVTGHLCREFSGHRWIPRTKVSDTEIWCFLCSATE